MAVFFGFDFFFSSPQKGSNVETFWASFVPVIIILQNVLKEKHSYNILMFTTLQFNNLFFSTILFCPACTQKKNEKSNLRSCYAIINNFIIL